MNDSNSPHHGGPSNDEFGAAAGESDDQIDAGLAALLADPNNWLDPPTGLDDRIVEAVHSERDLEELQPEVASTSAVGGRRLASIRPAIAGAAAAIVFVLGGIVVLSAVSGVEEAETFSAELISTGLILDVGGDIEVTSFDSGLRIELSAFGLPRREDGSFYAGWVRTADGNLFPVGTFHNGDDVTLWAGVELDRIDMFTVTRETAAEPTDAAQGSSGEVVLRVEIAP